VSFIARIRNLLLLLTVAVAPIEWMVPLSEVQPTAADPFRRFILGSLMDVPWAILTILGMPLLVNCWWRRKATWGLVATSVLFAAALGSWATAPSSLGASLMVRFLAAAVVVALVTGCERDEFRRYVAFPLVIMGAAQAALAVLQTLGSIAPPSFLLPLSNGVMFGSWRAGQGTTLHPYILAGWLLVTQAVGTALLPAGRVRWLWLAAIALMAAAIPTSGSRAAGLSITALVGALVWGWRSRPGQYGQSVLATGVPVLLIGAIVAQGWLARAARSIAPSVNLATSGRLSTFKTAIAMVCAHPWLGVGIGLYTIAVAAAPDARQTLRPIEVHFVPLLISAELGAPLGIAYSAFIAALALRAWKTSPAALAVFFSLVVFILLDKFTYSRPSGILLHALWLGTLDVLARPDFSADPDPLVTTRPPPSLAIV